MKMKLLHVALMSLTFSFAHANHKLEIDSQEVKTLIQSSTLYVIGVDDKCKWNKEKVKVKNFQTIGKGLLEFKFSKLDFNTYKKDTNFVISSNNDITSMKFVEKLRDLGFKNTKYLKDGNRSWNEVLVNFRGMKLFSMFSN